jgi:hypothetical protein
MNVYVLLDRSGSMNEKGRWAESIGAINGYVEKLTVDNVRYQVATFDNISYDVLRALGADKWVPLRVDEVSPRGGTPLYDAAGRLLTDVMRDNPTKAVIVIVTDGFENSSTEYTHKQISGLIKEVESKGYAVVFLGADFKEVVGEGAKIGVDYSRSMYMARGLTDVGLDMLSSKTVAYYNEVNTGYSAMAATMSYSEAERSILSGEKAPDVTAPVAVDLTQAPATVTKPTKPKTTKKKKGE